LSFRLRWQGQRLCVNVDHDEVVLEAPDGPVQLSVGADGVKITSDAPLRRPLHKREPLLVAPQQPAGREPPQVEHLP
ncbi:MAG: glycosyl hydrolase family 65 protein, partial [Acidimicrobiales bacterium]